MHGDGQGGGGGACFLRDEPASFDTGRQRLDNCGALRPFPGGHEEGAASVDVPALVVGLSPHQCL